MYYPVHTSKLVQWLFPKYLWRATPTADKKLYLTFDDDRRTLTIASKGFVIQIRNALGQYCLMALPIVEIIFVLVSSKSSRDMPGNLGIPAVIITTSEFLSDE